MHDIKLIREGVRMVREIGSHAITIYHNPACGTSRNVLADSAASAPELVNRARSMPGCERCTSASARSPGSSAQSIWTRLGRSASRAWRREPR